ncbi:hypothetical protein [Rhizobium leguminosarum]
MSLDTPIVLLEEGADLATLVRIANVPGISPNWLLGVTTDSTKDPRVAAIVAAKSRC